MIRNVLLLFVGLAASTTNALAWSLETHLYAAHKVLEDVLQDGKISLCANSTSQRPGIDCSKRYAVPAEVVSALRAHPKAFLAGTLGPDVYPDFITGQVTVHPGVPGGWLTDRWLSYLLRQANDPQQVAFAYGFMVHAASDIFAHTYVNAYAGDIFEISTHIKSNEVELRHFLLERYIADRTPSTWKARVDNGLLDAPTQFAVDRLIFDDGVVGQYTATMIPLHLVAIQNLHKTVKSIGEQSRRLTAQIIKEGALALLPVRAAEQYLAQTKSQLELARTALAAARSGMDQLDQAIRGLEDELLKVGKAVDDNVLQISGYRAQIEATKASIATAEASLAGLRNAVSEARKRVEDLRNSLQGIPDKISKEVCGKKWIADLIPFWKWVCDTVVETNPTWASTKAALDAAIGTLGAHEAALAATENAIHQAKQALNQLDANIQQAEARIAQLKLTQQSLGAQIALRREEWKVQQQILAAAEKAAEEAQKVVEKAQEELERAKKNFQPVAELLARYTLLNLYLANWEDDTGLLRIGDIARRVMKDSGLKNDDDIINEENFAPLYNSIVLSKLALLDKRGLNEAFTELTGQSTSPFGAGLYQEPSPRFFSLLEDAVHSIDGNHQWQAIALPYARESGNDKGWPDKRRYGSTHAAAHSGFRPWGYRVAREQMFLKIFAGPLHPNLEDHASMAASYPFPACAKNPFPSTTNEQGKLISTDLRCRFYAKSDASGLPGDFSALSSDKLSTDEMKNLTPWQLRIARNEVFARQGMTFTPPELQAHFAIQPWYKPTTISLRDAGKRLTSLEWRNIATLQRIEQQLNAGTGMPTHGP